jgi:hypothetical protein
VGNVIPSRGNGADPEASMTAFASPNKPFSAAHPVDQLEGIMMCSVTEA